MSQPVLPSGWTLIVPIKPFSRAKTRLTLPSADRRRLAEQFARHTLSCARDATSIGTIVVVGESAGIADVVLPDAGTLLSSLRRAQMWASHHRRKCPIATLPADLPMLTSTTLDEALSACDGLDRAFFADRSGEGTTLVTARTPEELTFAYGPGSASHHRRLGLNEITGEWHGLRDDVDTALELTMWQRICATPASRTPTTLGKEPCFSSNRGN